jgi:4-hydroxybenzoate polyprenyltransferase
MKLLKYFNIPELLILAIGMLTFKLGFLDRQAGALQSLSIGNYLLLILGTVLVAAAGFFMNNVFGYGKDTNPDVHEGKGYNIYIALNLVGIGIVYYLSNMLGKPMLLTGLYVTAAATMYVYATSLKEMVVVSNILVGLLTGLPVLAIGLFQLYPLMGVATEESKPVLALLFKIFIDYSVFTAVIGLALSLLYDLANSDADYNEGLNTLPIILGRDRAAKIAGGLLVVPVAMFVYYADTYLLQLLYAVAYGLVFVVGLLVYAIVKVLQAKSAKEFDHIVGIVKLVLLFTAFSIAVITFNINYAK